MMWGGIKKNLRLFSVVMSVWGLSACAHSAPGDEEVEDVDPFEGFNRGVFAFNQTMDALFLKPFAIMYRDILPPPIQEGTHNILANLDTPVILINDLLQLEMERAGQTMARFLINTTLGVGGIGDPATELGWKRHSEDFGQTLAVWGVPEGPYLMTPIFGPSNPRDLSGRVVDSLVFDPIGLLGALGNDDLLPYSLTRSVLRAVDARSRVIDELDELEQSSFDFYAALRSFYRQSRQAEIANRQTDDPATEGTFDLLPSIDEE